MGETTRWASRPTETKWLPRDLEVRRGGKYGELEEKGHIFRQGGKKNKEWFSVKGLDTEITLNKNVVGKEDFLGKRGEGYKPCRNARG